MTLVNSVLRYQRDGMPTSVAMESVDMDEFELVIPAGARVRGAVDGRLPTIRFNRSASGEGESLLVVNPDGSVAGTSEKK